MGKVNILLVEDDTNLGYVVKDFLELSGYRVDLKENGVEGLMAFESETYDMCILDVMMPLKDGFTLAREIREKNSMIPIVFLTSKSLTEDKLKGFRAGCDDYITKPFSTEELLSRIEVILKWAALSGIGTGSGIMQIGKYAFDYNSKTISNGENVQKLSNKESELLRLLYLNRNRLLRRDVALKTIWGEDDYFLGRSMDVYIAKLRKLLRDDPGVSISNIHGSGFCLEIEKD